MKHSSVGDASFQAFLPEFEVGISGFINGEAERWKQNASQREDVTVMGAWGGHEKGSSQAGPRYDWAADRFRASEAKVNVEYVTSGTSGDLAYTVAIERSEVCLANAASPAQMTLRVTHIFRREGGAWKLVHRHADPLTAKTAPASVLK
jgi:ketosteroid isomerase-like protein